MRKRRGAKRGGKERSRSHVPSPRLHAHPHTHTIEVETNQFENGEIEAHTSPDGCSSLERWQGLWFGRSNGCFANLKKEGELRKDFIRSASQSRSGSVLCLILLLTRETSTARHPLSLEPLARIFHFLRPETIISLGRSHFSIPRSDSTSMTMILLQRFLNFADIEIAC